MLVIYIRTEQLSSGLFPGEIALLKNCDRVSLFGKRFRSDLPPQTTSEPDIVDSEHRCDMQNLMRFANRRRPSPTSPLRTKARLPGDNYLASDASSISFTDLSQPMRSRTLARGSTKYNPSACRLMSTGLTSRSWVSHSCGVPSGLTFHTVFL